LQMPIIETKSLAEADSCPPIPFHRPLIGDDEIAAVTSCLRSGWLTSGPKVREFEEKFAQYIGAPQAIAVNSCTAAMHLALAALGIGPGDEVITSPYTFVATCEAIQYLGAKPVFVDIDARTLNLDPQLLSRALSERTRMILPVHIAGHPADLPEVMAFAKKHGLKVVEDAAHALESGIQCSAISDQYSDGHRHLTSGKIGTIGDATCFSFYATKNVTTGEGGMVTCQDPELAAHVRQLSLHGLSHDAWKRYTAMGTWYYEVVAQGYKYNLTDIAAALGLAQLAKVDAMWQRRAEIAGRYNAAFGDMPELEIPAVKPGNRHAWHLYILRLNPEKLSITRNAFFDELRRRGICCSVHFIPLHLMPYYRQTYGCNRGDFPEAERQFERVISLPFYPALTDTEVERIIAAVKQVIAEHARQPRVSYARRQAAPV
jgi:dTDP-4-amino-4,6-dideoxygalactose transaminase